MGSIGSDIKHALRAMRSNPVFAVAAVLTLALGIGANTAIFSVVHAVLLKPFSYPSVEPDRVLVLSEKSPNWAEMSVAYPNFQDWRSESTSFVAMAGARNSEYNMTGLEEPLRLRVRLVNKDYFSILNAAPILGRFFDDEEDRPGAPGTVVLNHPLWRNRFGGSTSVIGETVYLDGKDYSIVGVLPAGFEVDARERAYVPLEPWADNESTQFRGNHQGIYVYARLRDGVTFDEAQTEMETIASRLEREYPKWNTGVGVNIERLAERRVEEYRSTLWTLLAAVFLVLLVACANVANLLVARSLGRQRELAICVALGASTRRVVQRSLTEAALLSILGGVLGVGLAYASLGILQEMLPTDVPRLQNTTLNLTVLAFSLGVSLVTGLLFGLIPAVSAAHTRPSEPLREGGRGSGGHRSRAGRGLLVVEVALATMLLIGATLLIRSVSSLVRTDPGFETEKLLTLQVGVPYSKYDGPERQVLLSRLHAELGSLPGVSSAALGLVMPMQGSEWSSVFLVDDRPPPERTELPNSLFTPIGPNYFQTLGVPLIRGRTFDERDIEEAPRVAIVNQSFAERFWPNEDPIGRRLKQGFPESTGEGHPWREIVGVVGDTKQFGLDEEIRMQVFLPVTQTTLWSVRAALRSSIDPESLAESARRALDSIDPDLPVFDVETMASIIGRSVAPRRFLMNLMGLFAGAAMALAAVGLYGLVAYSVARRTREIGIRVAMGARSDDVFRLVVLDGMKWTVLGTVLGIGGAVVLSRSLETLLYGVGALDPFSFCIVPLGLLAVAFAASALPAWTAARLHPVVALRCE